MLPRAGRVLLILLALVILLTAGLAILARHYSGTIRQLALQEINSRLQVPVDVASASVTVWSHFPLIALDLHSILTREETVYGSQPPLLKAESIYLLFNPIDILRARYRIHKIVLVDGELNLVIFWSR